jgi:hypothetical protein
VWVFDSHSDGSCTRQRSGILDFGSFFVERLFSVQSAAVWTSASPNVAAQNTAQNSRCSFCWSSSGTFFFCSFVQLSLCLLKFRDFWLADQFCSMVILVTDVGYTGCFFIVDLGRSTDTCTSQVLPWLRPALACLPFWFRLLQCCRRYYDMRVYRDLLNAGKYFLSILLVVFAQLHTTLDGSDPWGVYRVFWIVCAVVATLSSFLWDVLMDWGIGRVHFKLLRRNVLFPKWCYYLAMPLNLVLRCAWLFTVAPSPFVGYLYEKALEVKIDVLFNSSF